ncbi:DUF935 domain-containing protein [Neoroseomonas alba]|nr:DUF935 domain-containing protein [Neoroseomonas alba]
MALLDQYGKPIPPASIRRLREEVAAPTLTGVRPVVSGHPAEGLTPARLAQIHRAAAQGDPLRYLELAEDIEERDLHYAGVIGTRKRSVAQLPITVEAASDAAEHVQHADFLRAWLKTGVLEGGLFDILDAVGKGFSVMEIMWRTDPGNIVPQRLAFRPQRWFSTDDDGDTIVLLEGATKQPLAPHKFVVHRHPNKSGLVMRSGLARVASWAWMYKSFTMKDWAIFVQNYGQPIRVGKYGPNASDADRDVLMRAVANIAGDCAAMIPESMLIEFIEAKNAVDGSALYEKRVDWLDRQISKLVLGQTTTTDAVSGGHAVAQEHRLVQEDIERADARMISTTATQQLGQLIIALNFGPQEAYPSIRIGRPDEVPLANVVDAVQKLGPLGLKVEASEIRDRLGLSEPAKGEDADVIGGRPPPPVQAPPGAEAKPPPPPELQAFQRRIASLHASQPETDVIQALTDRLALDAQGALAGVLDQVQAELHAASDLADFGRRLAGLRLDPEALAVVLGRGMAIAHLAGQAMVLDELQGG